MTAYPGTGRRRHLVILVAALMVLAGGLGTWYLVLSHQGEGGSGVVGDGPTFYGALGSVNSSVALQPGGPWLLSQVFGIATPVPSSPTVFAWDPYNLTLSSCQAAFNGLTIWNGTIPLFNGTFDSGTAPFWQFVFFSNATQQILVATSVLGASHVYAPIGMSSACAVYSGLGYQPWRSAWTFYRWAFPGNTPAMAASAWSAIGRSWVAWLGKEPTEMYYMGDVQFGSGQPFGTQTRFFMCGVEGAAGLTPGIDIFTNTFNTAEVTGWSNSTLGCTPDSNNLTPLPVKMQFSNSTVVTEAGSTYVRQGFQLLAIINSTDVYADSRGITSWMIALNLTDGTGQRLALAQSGCSAWVPTLTDCAANASGWYAVLLSSNGSWQGCFGASSSGMSWTSPVIPLASNQILEVIVPSTWNVSGDSLVAASTSSQLPLTGSIVFP